jgi:hypothetical protein
MQSFDRPKYIIPDGKNKIKDLQNFLSVSPLQVFNQTPDEKGLV